MIRRTTVGAALVYVALALWQMRAVLREPFKRLPFSTPFYEIGARFGFHDLKMVLSQIAYNARTLVSSPESVFDGPQCYPVEAASTFGEHMLGEGLAAVVPYWLFGDPLFAMTASIVLKPAIAALAAYALVLRWTRSPGAAFLAGLLFGFHPIRLIDPAHPYLSSNEWTMLGLLALDVVIAGGGWGWVLLFIAAASLQLLESFYPLLGFTFVVGIFGTWRLVVTTVPLSRLLPKLGFAAVALFAVVYVVLGPYLSTREIWPVLADRAVYVLNPLSKYLPGDVLFLGFTFWGLALAGLVDLVRRSGEPWWRDPRWPLLLGGALVFWFGFEDEFPALGLKVPALYHFLRWVPGVDAVRSPAVVTYAGLVAATVFAGYGARSVLERLGPVAARCTLAALALVWICEVLAPPVSTRVFGYGLEASPVEARPPDALLALHDELPPGPVLNLPWARGKSGEYLLLGAYHHRRIVSCYNSFEAPHAARVRQLAEAMPDPNAIRSLAALGVGSVVVHDDVWAKPAIRSRLGTIAPTPPGGPARLVTIGATNAHRAFALTADEVPVTDFAALRAIALPEMSVEPSAASPIEFTLENPSSRVFRHPFPIEPSRVLLRWTPVEGGTPFESRVRAMLPLVLVPGEHAVVEVQTDVPVSGVYDVTLHRVDAPGAALASRRVSVAPYSR